MNILKSKICDEKQSDLFAKGYERSKIHSVALPNGKLNKIEHSLTKLIKQQSKLTVPSRTRRRHKVHFSLLWPFEAQIIKPGFEINVLMYFHLSDIILYTT